MLAGILFLASQPLWASETQWSEIAPGASIRMVTSNKLDANGKLLAGIEMRLGSEFKTYWRIPGETGIPLTADWNGSKSVAETQIHWPMPKRATSYGMMDYVFEGDLTLPIEVTLDEGAVTASLNVSLTLGVCSDVCIPVSWSGTLPVDLEQPSLSNNQRLVSALINTPINDERSSAPFQQVGVDLEKNQLVFEAAQDELSNSSLIVDLPNQSLLFDAPIILPNSDAITVASLGDFDLSKLIKQKIRLTYDSAEGPFTAIVDVKLTKIVDGEAIFE